MKNTNIVLLTLLTVFTACNAPTNNTLEPYIAKNAMVVSAHPLASEIGAKIMKQGGNAVDAAVATGFALAVCYPSAGNLGGGGFMVIRLKNGETATLDYREKAPATATETMYLDSLGEPIEGKSLYTHHAAGVPGSVDGLITAWEKYGSLPFNKLIAPAIEMAENGFGLTEKQAAAYNNLRKTFLERNNYATAFTEKATWQAGDNFVQTDLANTLKAINQNGRAGFYAGKVAELTVAEMQKTGGLITLADLQNYQSAWREATTGTYREYEIISMPPPSSGGVALVQMLNMVENSDFSAIKHNNAAYLHLLAEAERRVYADRAKWLGDADFVRVPQSELMQKAYAVAQMANFTEVQATPSSKIAAGEFTGYQSEETTHYSVVDAQGNAMAVTTTINRSYGSRIVVEGAGYILNNEMDDFSIKPGVPNSFGLVGGKANAIAANKRMLSSMTPTIVTRNGKLFMVVGSPGGSTIITSVFQTILNVVAYGMNMQEAVAAPRFHHQWLPDQIYVEETKFTPETLEKLRTMGHSIKERGNIGRVDAILVFPSGELHGGADPRGDDAAVGY